MIFELLEGTTEGKKERSQRSFKEENKDERDEETRRITAFYKETRFLNVIEQAMYFNDSKLKQECHDLLSMNTTTFFGDNVSETNSSRKCLTNEKFIR